MSQVRTHLSEQFEPFSPNGEFKVRKTRSVSTGSYQTFDDSSTDRVGHHGEDHRDARGMLPYRSQCGRSYCHDHIRISAHEHSGVRSHSLVVTSTWKSVGDGLSFSTPAGVSWEAKLDGKEYPVKGTYANETVSLKQLGDRSIEATFKRDGKIVSVDKITVSGDGKKMTTVADNKLTGRVSTLIDEKQ